MSVKNRIRFKTEIVNGVCHTCEEQSRLVDKKRRAQKIKGTKKFKPPPPKRKIPTKPPVKTTGKVKLALRGGGRAYGKNS